MTTAHVIQERRFLPYVPFIDSAEHFCAELDRKEYVSWFDLMAATTLLALSVEALANTMGEHLVENFKDFESSAPKAKLRIIYQQVGLKFQRDRPPLSDVLWLLRVRNHLAHPKFKVLKTTSDEMPLAEAQKHYREIGEPLHEIERDISPENCKKWLKSVMAIRRQLEEHTDPSLWLIGSSKQLVINERDA